MRAATSAGAIGKPGALEVGCARSGGRWLAADIHAAVINLGPNNATNVRIVDTLPSGVTSVSAVPSQGSCTVTSTTVDCSLGTLLVEQSATVTLTVTPTTAGQITNTAVASADQNDTNPANNTASQTTTVSSQFNPFVVTTTANAGTGSLRAAITAANASTGTLDTITFAIPGAGPHVIALTTFLPTLTDRVIIDGTTQPGYNGTPLVELDGTSAGTTSNGLFIGTGGSGSTIRGLAIGGFGTGGAPGANGGAGIVIQGAGGNVIERNFLGTDATGVLARPNRADAIFVDNSPNNVIGGVDAGATGNLLSGNARYGLMLSGAGTTGTIVRNNRIGLSVNGSALGNGDAGVAIFGGSQNTIGSLVDGAGNLIAYNTGAGVHVATGTGNAVLLNNIFANGSLGINLGAATVTLNDTGDADTGPNNLQNFPVLTADAGGVQITLNGAPDTTTASSSSATRRATPRDTAKARRGSAPWR